MKYLSGDFISEYNRAMSSFKNEQKKLDEKYSESISNLVEREKLRLEQTVPHDFEIGSQVFNDDGEIGIVVSSHIELIANSFSRTEYGDLACGPNSYWPIENEEDEIAITCEGALRKYIVEFGSSEIEKDWGVDKRTVEFYHDELNNASFKK